MIPLARFFLASAQSGQARAAGQKQKAALFFAEELE